MESYHLHKLIELVEENHRVISSYNLPEPSYNLLKKSKYKESILKTYQLLGGKLATPEIKAPNWQIVLENNYIIILDEVLHFNRYRLQTLRSEVYGYLNEFPVDHYRNFCRKHERDCIKTGLAGKNWTFPLAEKHFGVAEERGDFSKNGAPAWKLRAFEDFLQDGVALHLQKKLIRIATYHQLMINRQLFKVGDVLTSGTQEHLKALQNYIDRKMSS
ncbi:MAG: hypothetical protein AAGI07_12130 [Bacteroidota bacterium]